MANHQLKQMSDAELEQLYGLKSKELRDLIEANKSFYCFEWIDKHQVGLATSICGLLGFVIEIAEEKQSRSGN
jgi:hypothetical protein